MNRTHWILIGTLAIALASTILLLMPAAPPSRAPSADTADSTQVASDPNVIVRQDGASVPDQNVLASTTALPEPAPTALPAASPGKAVWSAADLPADTPLVDAIDDLIKEADAGNQSAACRLAWDLDLCRIAGEQADSSFSRWETWAAQDVPGSREERDKIAFLQSISPWRNRALMVCKGLPDRYLRQSADRMLQAARLGELRSMARFGQSPPFPENLSLADLDTMTAFRDESLSMLERAANAGEPAALLGLYFANARGEIASVQGAVEIKADPVIAVAAGTALKAFSDASTNAGINETINRLMATMSKAQRVAARTQAARYAQIYRNQPPRDFASGIFRPYVGTTCVPSPR